MTSTATALGFLGAGEGVLDEGDVRAFIAGVLASADLRDQSVCLVVPDATRSCPLPLLLRAIYDELGDAVTRLTTLVALGTHAGLSDAQLGGLLGYDVLGLKRTYPGLEVVNHEWQDDQTFVSLGTIDADRVSEISEGRLNQPVEVRVNRLVVEHDVVLVVGPVFPHEVVGFSGGNKYFFPGVAAPELIDLSHWLGALITSKEIIGTRGTTPVRALIDEAAAMIPSRRLALCVVVEPGTNRLHALSFGPPEEAWARCADESARRHVRRLDAPVRRVLSLMPPKYTDMWTAAKGFYKVEPVVADGGEVVIYAPHITQVAPMHPEIEAVGYHCRDYFLAQWDRFDHIHWGVLAHSTHLHGAGSYDIATGLERPRVKVTLATGIPEETVRRIGLNYQDPDTLDVASYEADPDTLVVLDAGEVLFRLG